VKWYKALSHGLFITELIRVKQSAKHSFFRSILFFSKEKKEILVKELAIKDEHNAYTQAFADLLKEYYLFL
jgi:tRNA1(Val) A37 N6-methylase TrmN6